MSTKTGQVLVTSQTLAAAGIVRGRLDCSAAEGGEIRWRITHGATGPSAPCDVRIMKARKQASMPAAAAEGTGDDAWKRVFTANGGLVANASTRGAFRFGPETAYLQVEFTGNTAQDVVVECTGDTYA